MTATWGDVCWEDLPELIQEALKQLRIKEYSDLDQMDYPVHAHFGGEPVTVLGPIFRFEPYRKRSTSRAEHGQMMVAHADGSRFITLASMLRLPSGGFLVTPHPRLRYPPPSIFEKLRKFGMKGQQP